MTATDLELGEASDAEVALAARADARAFGELFVRHRVAVFRYLRARTPADEEAAELTAVTFERAFVAMPRYRATSDAGPLAWLLRIARNAAVDAARRRGRERPLDALAPERDPAGSVDPEAAAVGAEELRRLRELVRQLPEPQRDAVVLRYANDLSAREIAAVIGRSQAATEKLLVRGLARLKEAYRVERRA